MNAKAAAGWEYTWRGVALPAPDGDRSPLPSIWARQRIQQLELDRLGGYDSAAFAEEITINEATHPGYAGGSARGGGGVGGGPIGPLGVAGVAILAAIECRRRRKAERCPR